MQEELLRALKEAHPDDEESLQGLFRLLLRRLSVGNHISFKDLYLVLSHSEYLYLSDEKVYINREDAEAEAEAADKALLSMHLYLANPQNKHTVISLKDYHDKLKDEIRYADIRERRALG